MLRFTMSCIMKTIISNHGEEEKMDLKDTSVRHMKIYATFTR